MTMPTPTEAHRRLERLVGRWFGEETMHPSPWSREGGEAIGRVENRLALDGFAVVQDYAQERDGVVTYRGHGVFTWDPSGQQYVLYWFDSFGTPVNDYRGDFDGNVLRLTFRMEQGYSRSVFDLDSPDRYTFRMEFSGDGAAWQPFVEGVYKRQT